MPLAFFSKRTNTGHVFSKFGNENEPATKSAASSELKAVNRTVHRAVVIDDDDDDGDDIDTSAAVILLVVSSKSSLSISRLSTHWHLHTTLPYKRINPLKGSGIGWLHFKVFSAIQV